MTYKETLFFIGKCLTISHEKENLNIVSKLIKNNDVDWDAVVKVSTQHYVFPALYCNLKRAELLSHLPQDLVDYMKHITDLNRDRNLQIIAQAKEINELLTKNDITPIFLKGTGFLLQDFYEDIAERMVGDIDFLVSKKDFQKTISILENDGYSHVIKSKYHYPSYKHHPRIQKEGKIAAVEIHHEMTIDNYTKEFNYNSVIENSVTYKSYKFLGLSDQLCLVVIAKQINDSGQYFKSMSLRNSYDVFVLSKKINPLLSIKIYPILFPALNDFLAFSNKVFHSDSINFETNSRSKKNLAQFEFLLDNQQQRAQFYKKLSRKIFIKKRFEFLLKSIIKKDYRYWLFKRITDPQWYREKMIQLGIKSGS